jgi:hypothetical protein
VNQPAPDTAPPAARRRLKFAAAIGVLLLIAALGLDYVMQPQRATGLLLEQVGQRLGLRITAGRADYRLRGTPQLVLHDVVAQRPGDDVALLRAKRAFVALPWDTLRSRGERLSVQRIELDAPVLDIPALQRWLATRPPGEDTRIPTLTHGLRVRDGRIDNAGWRIDGIAIDLPALAPGKPLQARVRGRYLDPPLGLPFDLRVAMSAPDNGAGLAALGWLTVEGDEWRMPGRLDLSGPLRVGDGEFALLPARIGLAASYQSTSTRLPFVLGAHGPLQFRRGVWSLDPAVLQLRGEGAIPQADARGALALGQRLVLRLDGRIAGWPQAWPALPPPLSESDSQLAFALDYAGRSNLSDTSHLRLRRDATEFEARFRLPRVMDWLEAAGTGTPLPPLDGRLRTPRLDIAGAQLHGVEMEFADESPEPSPTPP